jgi:hypothetical protein
MHFAARLLSRALLVGSLVVTAGFASAAMADTQTQAVGNSSGQPFSFRCKPGEGLVGWSYNATDHMTLIAPVCQKVEAAAEGFTAVGAPPPPPEGGYGAVDPAAKSGDLILCPDLGIMRGLQVAVTKTLRVHHVRATCKAINHAPVLIKPTLTDGGESTAQSSVSCDSRESYATGIFGTASKSLATGGVMSLGLFCFSADTPKTDDTADTGDDDTQQADTGDNGDDTGDNADQGNGDLHLQITIGPDGITFGPQGKVRVLKQPSTLYSDKGNTEIAYFDKGDKVVVLGCEDKGRGWCQVVKPQPGLIWGDDLK